LKDVYIEGLNSEEGSEFKGTYYTTEFWKKKLSQYFFIEKTIPRGLFGHQSFS